MGETTINMEAKKKKKNQCNGLGKFQEKSNR